MNSDAALIKNIAAQYSFFDKSYKCSTHRHQYFNISDNISSRCPIQFMIIAHSRNRVNLISANYIHNIIDPKDLPIPIELTRRSDQIKSLASPIS